MEFLVTYDVNTATVDGERRLRRVAKVCEGFGQRVQKSVFELSLDRTQVETFVELVVAQAKMDEDSIRIYRLNEPREKHLQTFGVVPKWDIRGPLVV